MMSNKPGKRKRYQGQSQSQSQAHPKPDENDEQEQDEDGEPQLGYLRLLASGLTPEQAWLRLRDNLVDEPDAVEILRMAFEQNPQFREENRAEWPGRGFDPPWQGLIEL